MLRGVRSIKLKKGSQSEHHCLSTSKKSSSAWRGYKKKLLLFTGCDTFKKIKEILLVNPVAITLLIIYVWLYYVRTFDPHTVYTYLHPYKNTLLVVRYLKILAVWPSTMIIMVKTWGGGEEAISGRLSNLKCLCVCLQQLMPSIFHTRREGSFINTDWLSINGQRTTHLNWPSTDNNKMGGRRNIKHVLIYLTPCRQQQLPRSH